jgi:anti-repressor protein
MYAKDELLDNPDLLIQVATELKKEREEKKLLQEQMKKQKPKVLFAEAVSVAHTSILVGDLAKLIKQNGVDIGAKRLFAWLRENGYLIKRKGTDYNMPTQYSMDLGLFEVKETSITHSDGHISISKTPKITGKGQIYFINKFMKNQAENEVACTK